VTPSLVPFRPSPIVKMSSLYPSLEGMKIDQMMQVRTHSFITLFVTLFITFFITLMTKLSSSFIQVQSQIMASQQAQQVQQPAQPSGSVPSSPSTADGAALPYSVNPDSAPMYPGLGNYMGLELSEDVIRENMPEYLNPGGSGQPHGPSGATRPQVRIYP
jgi:hypothetical protein